MLRGLLVELSPHERSTLLRVANGDDRSGTHNPTDVKRLQLLALIEDEGPFIHMTALGKQRVEWLGVGNNLLGWPSLLVSEPLGGAGRGTCKEFSNEKSFGRGDSP
jgi:hypothetical protein